MKLVVDTNILFGWFWKNSLTRRLLENIRIEFIFPEKGIEEINKYKKEIMIKTKIKRRDFELELNNLKQVVGFVKKGSYSSFNKIAEEFCPDKGDIDFLALCLKEKCSLWSNDYALKEQEKVKVMSTKEIINILF